MQRFLEQQKANELALRFYDAPAIDETVQTIAANARTFPIEDVVVVDFLYAEYRKPLLKSLLQKLVPENVLVWITSGNIDGDQTEPWHKTMYRSSRIAKEMITQWNCSPGNLTTMLKLPEINPFLSNADAIVNNDRKQFTNIKAEPRLLCSCQMLVYSKFGIENYVGLEIPRNFPFLFHRKLSVFRCSHAHFLHVASTIILEIKIDF